MEAILLFVINIIIINGAVAIILRWLFVLDKFKLKGIEIKDFQD